VRGSHIVVRKLFDHRLAYFFQLPDGRIFFAIPYEEDFTLIGTTDADHQGPLDHVEASAEEIAYLCDGANRFFRHQIAPADVVWSYAGVRPLIDDGSGRPEAATRGYRLEMSGRHEGATLLNVFGGKLTTYRHLAQEAVDLLGERLELDDCAGWTGERALPGGDFAHGTIAELIARIGARYRFLEPQTVRRMARAYGTTTFAILGEAASLAECGTHFGHGLTQREVDHLIAKEWARTAQDILWRRTKLGLRLSPHEAAVLADYCNERIAA
jgi:glycerol-3-phosphate dehydrogenase